VHDKAAAPGNRLFGVQGTLIEKSGGSIRPCETRPEFEENPDLYAVSSPSGCERARTAGSEQLDAVRQAMAMNSPDETELTLVPSACPPPRAGVIATGARRNAVCGRGGTAHLSRDARLVHTAGRPRGIDRRRLRGRSNAGVPYRRQQSRYSRHSYARKSPATTCAIFE